MTLSDIVSIAVALTLTYFMLSLLASSVHESISAMLSKRSKDLSAAIHDLVLSGPDKTNTSLHELAEKLHGHALISGTSQNGKPSYLPSRNFTLALLDLLDKGSQSTGYAAVKKAIDNLPEGSILKQRLSVLAKDAAGDLNAFKAAIDTWFDDAMDRLGGEYKRWSQLVLLGIGFAVAGIMNVDTFHIAGTLLADAQLRSSLAAHGEAFAKAGPPPAGQQASVDALARQIGDLPLPIGWNFCTGEASKTPTPPGVPAPGAAGAVSHRCLPADSSAIVPIILMIPGWLFTAIAISFGAPFWFELLNQFVNLRSTGPKAGRADEKQGATSQKQASAP